MKPQEAQELMNKEFVEAMNKSFPVELIHEEFYETLPILLANETPKSLQISWDLFKLLSQGATDLTISEMGAALNGITNSSYSDFRKQNVHWSKVDYFRIMDWAFAMASEWNKIVSATQERLNSKYATMLKLTSGIA